MHAIFVHGLGRTPLSALPLLLPLRKAGISCHVLGYLAATEDTDRVAARLKRKIDKLDQAPYVLIGHSLGGVIIRKLLTGAQAPKSLPLWVFLLGSPTGVSRLAHKLQHHPLFRLFAGDAGQLLGNAQRMAAIGAPNLLLGIPCTAIIGTRGIGGRIPPFYGESNDGIVAKSEVTAPWLLEDRLGECIELPLPHTLLPSSRRVAKVIIERLSAMTSTDRDRSTAHTQDCESQ
ncbi:alpha/beta hydrolase [Shewanella cyperi]|uniref:Alpha/beta hydrolase n=1 Tax=Shewanella cyperi TaxID=2814292 RepID=A0A974XL90_9GAMM|nr:alpha/beta hydrolase [Shewanella cyperi]QSX29308.1 alpha/beta hydrolase [Shewanella cyperi]